MPFYSYTSITSDGVEDTKILEAPTLEAAAAELRKRRVMVTGLHETGTQAGADAAGVPSLGWVRSTDVVVFFTELSALIKAGVTLVAALRVLEDQTPRGRLRGVIASIRLSVEQGGSFASALRRYPRIFSPVIVSMIEAGEVGGLLDTVLERVADMLESRAQFRSQALTSLIYPAVVMTFALGAVIFLIMFVIPRIEPFITSRGGRLAWNTKLLLSVKDVLTADWLYIVCVVAGAAAAFFMASRTPAGRLLIDKTKLRLPIIGPVFLYAAVIQFTRNLASLVNSGVPLLVALRTVRETIGNEELARLVDEMHDRVAQGESLSKPLKESKTVPPMVAGMVAVGEETGDLDRSLDLVANIFEKLLQKRTRRLNILMEPALTFILFIVVGFIGWSLLSGVWSTYTIL